MQFKPYNTGFRTGIFGMMVIMIMLVLAACGSNSTTDSSSSSGGGSTHSNTPAPAQDPNHISLAKMIGTPRAKITSGTNFQVAGQIQNLDTRQHDIHLQATLKNASGQVVGTATGLADNVPGGKTDSYTLSGTLTQPTWSTISVVITKVTENVNGEGSD